MEPAAPIVERAALRALDAPTPAWLIAAFIVVVLWVIYEVRRKA